MTSEAPYHDQGQANGTYSLKVLVPSVAAGAIIGKKGEIIAHLQEETGAKVKMSKATDFYPGTTERVCLISGSVEAILRLHEFIMLKILERPDPNAKMAVNFDQKRPVEREKQVKILVPNSTAAMIIGKCGSYIKQIKEESGAYIQISQNDKGNCTLAERCITVIGEMENNKIACRMILSKIVKDPHSGSCSYVSYANITGPIPNFDPIGSPFANHCHVPNDAISDNSNTNSNFSGNFENLNPTASNNFLSLQTSATSPGIVPFTGVRVGGSPVPVTNIVQVIDAVKRMLISNGYSEQATSEITAAMNTLANYGILGIDLGILIGAPAVNNLEMPLPNSASSCPISSGAIVNQGVYASAAVVPEMEVACSSASASDSIIETQSRMFGYTDSVEMSSPTFRQGFTSPTSFPSDSFLKQTEVNAFESFSKTSPVLASPSAASLPANANPFVFGSHSDSPDVKKYSEFSDRQKNETMKVDIEVGENVIGAIFGPEGKALADLARFSGAKIKISKKGEYAPGTYNRIVTISGDSSAINIAQYLIERQIVQEEIKRAQQNAINQY